MVKKKKLKYQPIWDAVRSAYPDWMHNKVDELAGKIFGQVKFDRVQYQEKLAELQEKAAKRKRKSLLFWKKPAAKKAKTEKKPEAKQAASSTLQKLAQQIIEGRHTLGPKAQFLTRTRFRASASNL